MGQRGVLFALDESLVDRLTSLDDLDDRLDFLEMEIEEPFFEEQPELVYETDKAWDAIHRCLTDGKLEWDNGAYPLNHAILGGEQLYDADDYVMSLKSPDQARDIAGALAKITVEVFREGYARMTDDYDGPRGLENLQYSWDWFDGLAAFYRRAAEAGRFVLFTVDL